MSTLIAGTVGWSPKESGTLMAPTLSGCRDRAVASEEAQIRRGVEIVRAMSIGDHPNRQSGFEGLAIMATKRVRTVAEHELDVGRHREDVGAFVSPIRCDGHAFEGRNPRQA